MLVDGGWFVAAPLTTPRAGLAVAALDDGALYALGGRTGGQSSRLVEVFLPAQNVWSPGPQLPTARSELAAVAAPDGRLWAIGGNANGTAADTVEALFPSPVGVWVTLPFLHTHRSGVAAAIAPDGRLVVFGGSENGPTPPVHAELYGPAVQMATTLAVGAMGSISGTNFAANARVTATLTPGSAVLARGETNVAGALATVSFTVPELAAGSYTVTVVDDRSRYPIHLSLELTR